MTDYFVTEGTELGRILWRGNPDDLDRMMVAAHHPSRHQELYIDPAVFNMAAAVAAADDALIERIARRAGRFPSTIRAVLAAVREEVGERP